MKDATQNRLQALREEAEMSRVSVAAHVGVGEQQVRRWEDGELFIPTKHLAALSELFDCTVEHLLGWDREEAKA